MVKRILIIACMSITPLFFVGCSLNKSVISVPQGKFSKYVDVIETKTATAPKTYGKNIIYSQNTPSQKETFDVSFEFEDLK